jgi:hypothetical protein
MKTSTILKYLAGAAAALGLALAACEQSAEGDRCNPDLAAGETDCNSGLKCTAAGPLCPENYCCPVTADGGLGPSSNPFCQPGCNGGAASICNAGQSGDTAACAFACQNDPSDLKDPGTQCDAGSPDGGDDGPEPTPDSGGDAGDAGHEGSPGDGGPG